MPYPPRPEKAGDTSLKPSEFRELFDQDIRRLFQEARGTDELSFLFAVLGINSGMEDPGWQPIGETQALVQDLVGLVNAPLSDHTKVRLLLLLYCHVIEANFLYHCIYNLLLTVERQPPKVFNFLDKYQKGVPPSFSTKISEISAKADQHGFATRKIFAEIIRPDIRNAFFHSDYILFADELRLKHKGMEYARIPFSEVSELSQKTLDFFSCFMSRLMEARRSFPNGYKITGRKNAAGHNLSDVDVTVDQNGVAIGFSCSSPLPIW